VILAFVFLIQIRRSSPSTKHLSSSLPRVSDENEGYRRCAASPYARGSHAAHNKPGICRSAVRRQYLSDFLTEFPATQTHGPHVYNSKPCIHHWFGRNAHVAEIALIWKIGITSLYFVKVSSFTPRSDVASSLSCAFSHGLVVNHAYSPQSVIVPFPFISCSLPSGMTPL